MKFNHPTCFDTGPLIAQSYPRDRLNSYLQVIFYFTFFNKMNATVYTLIIQSFLLIH